jgi:hypothetical protein
LATDGLTVIEIGESAPAYADAATIPVTIANLVKRSIARPSFLPLVLRNLVATDVRRH